MNSRLRADRSTEAPMDFEYTSRPSSKSIPVWAHPGQDPQTPRKRGFDDVNPSTPSFPLQSTPTRPTFGQHNGNFPFLFNEPVPQTQHAPAWTPPPNFSPTKAFPQPEIPDVEMNDSSPVAPSPDKDESKERTMAIGALRRVFKKRTERDRSRLGRQRVRVNDEESSEGEGESGGEEDRYAPVTQKTTNHYTLNMPGPSAPQSDLPFRLLGFVQVFFNGSLAAIAIYLLVQFILTIQRDVEHRIGEYSMDIVQEIAQCQLAYKANLCAGGTIPAMAAQCAAWETCMNRDPTKVGRAKVSVEVIGEVINSFVEPISWKTLGFTVAALAFMTLFINSLLMLFRSRVNPATHHASPPPVPPYPMVAGMPYHPPQGYLPPAHDWGSKAWNPADNKDEKATRRRRLEGGQAAKVK